MAIKQLPSILDRLADDAYLNSKLDLCRQTINQLERQIVELSPTATAEKANLLNELKKQRLHSSTLQTTLGNSQNIRDCVKRDLSWLLNATNLCSSELIEEYPEVAGSVLNYGLPDLAGRTSSSLVGMNLEAILKKVIKTFEPRIIPDSLTVKLVNKESQQASNGLAFEISGWSWSEPTPLRLQLMT